MITDSTGSVLGQQGHYPFGEQWYAQNATSKWLFTGGVYPERGRRERDAESGNAHSASRMGLRDDYAMARYNVNRLGRPDAYSPMRDGPPDPGSDRFAPAQRPRDDCMPGQASPDLLAGSAPDPQTLNRYAGVYPERSRRVRDDPVNLVDPLGLDCNWWNGDTPECENGAGPGTYYDAFGYCAPQYEYCWSSGWDWPSWNERCTWEDRDGPPRLLVCFQPAGSETSGLGDTDPGHGGGGAIAKALEKLRSLLKLDKKCADSLDSKKGDVLGDIGTLLQFGAFGATAIPPIQNPDGTTTVVNAASGGYIQGQAITVNTNGAFFNSTFNGAPLAEDRGRIRGGTDAAQGFILLHEMGHIEDVLVPDAGNQKLVDQNNKSLEKNCKKTIDALKGGGGD